MAFIAHLQNKRQEIGAHLIRAREIASMLAREQSHKLLNSKKNLNVFKETTSYY